MSSPIRRLRKTNEQIAEQVDAAIEKMFANFGYDAVAELEKTLRALDWELEQRKIDALQKRWREET
jgi:hypothetical protein